MTAVAALLDDRAAVLSLRRSLPRGGARVVSCRSTPALDRMLGRRLTDAVVLSPGRVDAAEVAALRERFPEIPMVLFGPLRPDSAAVLMGCLRAGADAAAVADVDEAVVGEMVQRVSLTARRRKAMSDAVRVLRLDEEIQRRAWEVLVSDVERPVRTSDLAQRLGVSREHLSRQFGAGGAPNLKRVIDLTRIAAASQLLRNPAHSAQCVVRILGFSSTAHLASTARRIAGVPAAGLGRLGPRGVLAHFVRGNTRSRH